MAERFNAFPSGRIGKIVRYEIQSRLNTTREHLKRSKQYDEDYFRAKNMLNEGVTTEALNLLNEAMGNQMNEVLDGMDRKRRVVFFNKTVVNLPSKPYF